MAGTCTIKPTTKGFQVVGPRGKLLGTHATREQAEAQARVVALRSGGGPFDRRRRR